MIEYIGGGHGCCVSHDHCGHHHHDDFLLKDTISNVEDLYDVLMTHISKKSIHTPKDEIIKLIDDSIDEALNSINDRDYLTIDEVRAEFEKLIKKQNFLTEIPDEYITESELSSEIDRRIRLLNLSQYLTVSSLNGYVKSSDLNEYAKHSWVTSLGYITKEQADAWYAKKGESSGNSTTYGLSISGQTLSLVKNGTTLSVIIPSTGGSTVIVNPTLTTGVKIADITVGSTTKSLYAPQGEGGPGSGSGDTIYPIEAISAFSDKTIINRDEERDCPTGWYESISYVHKKPIYMVLAKKRGSEYVRWSDGHIWTEPVEIVSLPENAISSLLAFSSSETLNKNEERDCPTGWHTSIADVTGDTIYMTQARKKGDVYLKWTNNNIWSDPIKVFNANTENTGTPGSPNVVVIDESDFDQNNYLPGVLYILTDGNGHVIKMFKDGVWTYVNSSGYCSLADWNNIHINENNNVFYVITDANGTIIGYGLNGVFMSIPIPADGTIVTLTKDQYDQLVEDGLMVATTMYAITDENGNVLYFMLAGKVIPIGEDGNTEAIKSQLTTLFSLKFGVEVDDNGNWRISNLTFSKVDVGTPGMSQLVSGFENYINDETYTGGVITKANAETALSELFASYVKNDDSAIASVKSFVENDLADVQTVATLQKNNKIVTASTTNHADDDGADIIMSVGYIDKDLNARTADLKLEVGADSKVSINADHINLNADQITAVANEVDVQGLLYAKDSVFIGGPNESKASSQFLKNGSGYVANGNIMWDNVGNATFTGTVNAQSGRFRGAVESTDFLVINSMNKPTMELTTIGTKNLKVTNPDALRNAGLADADNDTPIILVTLYEDDGTIKDLWIVKFEKLTTTVQNLVSNYFTNAIKITEQRPVSTNILHIYKYYDGTLGDSPTVKQEIDGLYALKYQTQHAIRIDINRYCLCNTNTYVVFNISNGVATFAGSFYTNPQTTCTYDELGNPIINPINYKDIYITLGVEKDNSESSKLYYENGQYIGNGTTIEGGIPWLFPNESVDRIVPMESDMDLDAMLYNFDEETLLFVQQNVKNILLKF